MQHVVMDREFVFQCKGCVFSHQPSDVHSESPHAQELHHGIADVDMLEQLKATDDVVPPLYACLVILRKIS